MSEIKVGDLVMVMRLSIHGCGADGRGKISPVLELLDGPKLCSCNTQLGSFVSARLEFGWVALSRLKRIDPPSDEMERETERERETT